MVSCPPRQCPVWYVNTAVRWGVSYWPRRTTPGVWTLTSASSSIRLTEVSEFIARTCGGGHDLIARKCSVGHDLIARTCGGGHDLIVRTYDGGHDLISRTCGVGHNLIARTCGGGHNLIARALHRYDLDRGDVTHARTIHAIHAFTRDQFFVRLRCCSMKYSRVSFVCYISN